MKFEFRDWQKRFYFPDAVYFVTFYTKSRYPFFRERIFADLFVENLQFCKKLKGCLLFGWVLCYEHAHLLLQPNNIWNISDVIHSLKRHISRNMNILIDSISESADSYPHFQGEDLCCFFPKFKWQKSFYDHYIRNDRDFDCHMEYIADNPFKHGLLSDWPYVYTNSKYDDLTNDYI
ncbi:transposase [Candidatus Peregrinibacteria bacterium]|nr:transposase [Candidatus Peregrinibacteria bacterium]